MVTERARTYPKWLALTAALMCGAWFATQLGMNYAGYCRAEGRFLSDAERIDRVVELELSVYPPVVPLEKTDASGKPYIDNQRPDKPIYYADAAEYFRLNPDCCSLVQLAPFGWWPYFVNRITGRIAVYVRTRYRVRYFDEHGVATETIVEPAAATTNCGHPWSGV